MQVIGNIFWSFYFFEVLRCFSILKNPQEILENKFADDDKESLQVLADQEEDIDQSPNRKIRIRWNWMIELQIFIT